MIEKKKTKKEKNKMATATAEVKKEVKKDKDVVSKSTGNESITLPASHLTASVKQMTGVEEEILTDPKLSRNAGKLITSLLHSTVITLDGNNPSIDTIRNLTIGDRDYLLMELRKVSLGSEIPMSFQCPSCSANVEIEYDLNEINTIVAKKNAPLEIEVELVDGHTDDDGAVHKDAVVTLPTGLTQERTAAIMRQNVAKGNTEMLLQTVHKLGTLEKVTSTLIRGLTKRDRDVLTKVVSREAPGPKLSIDVDCYECGYNFETVMDLANFFVLN